MMCVQLYREVGVAVEGAAVAGYNACVLAYGQSGTGKTFTVLGDKVMSLSLQLCKKIKAAFNRNKVVPKD